MKSMTYVITGTAGPGVTPAVIGCAGVAAGDLAAK
jgi:hypothetical protein